MGDVAAVQHLVRTARLNKLSVSLQKSIVRESVNNILLLDTLENAKKIAWETTKGIKRPQQKAAVEIFECVSKVQWNLASLDIALTIQELWNDKIFIPDTVDVNRLTLNFFTQQNWETIDKYDIFCKMCRDLSNKYIRSQRLQSWALSEIYQAWRMDLKADNITLNRYSLDRDGPIKMPLLQRCVQYVPKNFMMDMVHNGVSPNTLNKCVDIFERDDLDEDMLYTFIQKGMDIFTVLNNRYSHRNDHQSSLDYLKKELAYDSARAIEVLNRVEERIFAEHQKSVLLEEVETISIVQPREELKIRRKL